MSASKLSLTIFLLLGAWALVAGCGNDPVSPVEDEVPVLPVENVTAVTSDVDKLVIHWQPNSHPQLRGYKVYRADVAAQVVALLTPTPIYQTEYRDMSARRGVEYEYRVTAVTKAGKESVYTPVDVLLEANPMESPGNPGAKKALE
jgi:fibronectin type 3 domain-containing protein